MTAPRPPLLLLLVACACSNRYEDTVAALRGGDLDKAQAAAESTEWHDFVRGNVAFARSEAAENLDIQVALAEDAVAAWRTAAIKRDWPEARRNVERGLLRLERLWEKKRGKPPEPKPPPKPPPPAEGEKGPETEAELEKGELAPAQVLRLLELLREKEAKKVAARRARLGAPQPGVEKDW